MSGRAQTMATHSGLRGPGLSGADVERTVGGFLALLERRGIEGPLAMGSDGRPGNEELCEQVVATVTGAGRDLVDFGIVSTPTAKIAARAHGLAGAVIVTASHLPNGWNGLKLAVAPSFFPVDVGALPRAGRRAGGERGELRADAGAAALHADAVCAAADAEAIRALGATVLLRGGAGDAAAIALERLGVATSSGSERLGADAGLVLDADADRLALIDERGAELDEEATLALVVLAERPGAVVKGADTSLMIDDLVGGWGGSVTTVPPGELHLVTALSERGAAVAGEGNGGVAIARVAPARDGLGAAASILGLLAREGRPLSELAAALPAYARRRERVGCSRHEDAGAAIAAVARAFGVALEPRLGVRIEDADGTWAMVRPSATEPILRFTVEGTDEDAVTARLRAIMDVAEEAMGGAGS